ncbi:hypothetical protein C8J57DRAFT_1522571 [Mycena rebaudengoi]|nr:hypothetical protein C8J57DRAFT_1522571 [Mycena rebaudengoi]
MDKLQYDHDFWRGKLGDLSNASLDNKLHLILSLVIFLAVSIRELLVFIFTTELKPVKDRAARFLGYSPTRDDPNLRFPAAHIFSVWLERCHTPEQRAQMRLMITPLAPQSCEPFEDQALAIARASQEYAVKSTENSTNENELPELREKSESKERNKLRGNFCVGDSRTVATRIPTACPRVPAALQSPNAALQSVKSGDESKLRRFFAPNVHVVVLSTLPNFGKRRIRRRLGAFIDDWAQLSVTRWERIRRIFALFWASSPLHSQLSISALRYSTFGAFNFLILKPHPITRQFLTLTPPVSNSLFFHSQIQDAFLATYVPFISSYPEPKTQFSTMRSKISITFTCAHPAICSYTNDSHRLLSQPLPYAFYRTKRPPIQSSVLRALIQCRTRLP